MPARRNRAARGRESRPQDSSRPQVRAISSLRNTNFRDFRLKNSLEAILNAVSSTSDHLERLRLGLEAGLRGAPSNPASAFRCFAGEGSGIDGVFVDVYADCAVLIEYEGRVPSGWDTKAAAQECLRALSPRVRSVYSKPFMKDRSKLGGELPACVTDPEPAAGERCAEWFLIEEDSMKLEVRMYDGLSTGIFLDQSSNRSRLKTLVAKRRAKTGNPVRVLNTFSYTCAFSVATALGGAETTSVDVSARYLEWGKRNFAHNGLDASAHRFAKMGTFEFLDYAKRKNLTYDMIILDPPSYASGSKKNDVRAWSSVSDYRKLVGAAAEALNPEGLIFASTNTIELCAPGRLQAEVRKGLNREPRYVELPGPARGFAKEKERFCALLFSP